MRSVRERALPIMPLAPVIRIFFPEESLPSIIEVFESIVFSILVSTYFWVHGQGLGAILLEKTNAIVDLYIVALNDRGHTLNPSISLQLEAIKETFSNTAPALLRFFG